MCLFLMNRRIALHTSNFVSTMRCPLIGAPSVNVAGVPQQQLSGSIKDQHQSISQPQLSSIILLEQSHLLKFPLILILKVTSRFHLLS
ncbi:hypothetical protein PVAP13_8NG173800 [Panicum virgatum]|uniref:Uncharacterized protein n=1 Tax=Panicum virgatum TaxID=38727 RepID=A0A8T0P656_PANVG|nr:hypothetical protein PVAP13_8NG173800 [Panicum virgatum]